MNGFYHLRARIRAKKGLETFPSRDKTRRFLDYLMYAVGLLAPLALVPQILQIYGSRSAIGMSLLTWCLLASVNVLWGLYGAAHSDKHILFANILMFFFNSSIIVGILLY